MNHLLQLEDEVKRKNIEERRRISCEIETEDGIERIQTPCLLSIRLL